METQPGFTLIELCMTLAVVAVVTALAAPSVTQARRDANALAVYHSTTSSLALARSLAVTRGHPVTLCPSDDGHSCTGGVDWSAGWIMYLDRTRSSQPENASAVMEVSPPLKRGFALRSSAGRQRIRYLPHGWASGSNVSLALCSGGDSRLLGKVVVNNAGRARIQRAAGPTDCPGA
ncbi:GspH/FimT family protein [Luteimonas terricola]|uniref:Type II secretion system protein H n=1 Tax=Luteimonas terricola TaxID=645597 RepID=A0ABQ2EGR3_9GAMM|nr:GspH/FimT family pseudopilin [Luteimonas terricola]GGK10903.1 prepilin-type N-terminal cleavage/methylation domain-containing protein [Luteimonas terricola]